MRNLKNIAPVVVIPVVLILGVATGLLMRPTMDLALGLQAGGADDPHAGHNHSTQGCDQSDSPYARHAAKKAAEEEDHLPLTRQAYQNLSLSLATVELSSFVKTLRMPGEIIEAPGHSSRKVAAPVSGRVTRLFALPGVAVAPGNPLLELEIIDDQLMQAQLRLLELLTKQEIVESELARLAPLAAAGGVAGRRRLEQEYQQKETASSLSRTRQELAMRGLSAAQVVKVVQSRKALQTLTVVAPKASRTLKSQDAGPSGVALSSYDALPLNRDSTVESLRVEVGQSIERGEPVCDLASHGLLMVCGHTFEREIAAVTNAVERKLPVSLELGADGAGQGSEIPGLSIQYVAGHADEKTQTFHFYIPLRNRIASETRDSQGHVYRTWRHKVGQRVHVMIPVGQIEGHIVLPRDAVVQEGPRAMVFRKLPDQHLEAEEGVFIEFEPTPVTIVARDNRAVVIAPGEELTIGDQVASASAYQLHLALKSKKEGGSGGHHHQH